MAGGREAEAGAAEAVGEAAQGAPAAAAPAAAAGAPASQAGPAVAARAGAAVPHAAEADPAAAAAAEEEPHWGDAVAVLGPLHHLRSHGDQRRGGRDARNPRGTQQKHAVGGKEGAAVRSEAAVPGAAAGAGLEPEGGRGPAAHQPDLDAVRRRGLPSAAPPPCGLRRHPESPGEQHVAQCAAPVRPPHRHCHLRQQLQSGQPGQLPHRRLDRRGGGDPALRTQNHLDAKSSENSIFQCCRNEKSTGGGGKPSSHRNPISLMLLIFI